MSFCATAMSCSSAYVRSKIHMALGIMADVDLHTEDGKDYLEITVAPSSFPVSYRGEFHYRSGATRRQLTGMALADFVMRRTGTHWDEALVENASLDDIDEESIKIFKREALRHRRMTAEELDVSNEELLDKLGLLVDGKLTRAGVLLFTEKHFAAQTAAYTKVGMFGEGRADLLYQDVFDGSLINTASKILETIFLKYLRASITYERGLRIETYPFEYDAVREGIYNALIHNVYMTGVPIQIRIDERTMEISNSCILPEDWTVESLMEPHKSMPYNPSIANVFYRMGYIENWGRGIERIVAACEELGAPRPEYEVVGYSITMRLYALASAIVSNAKLMDNTETAGNLDAASSKGSPKDQGDTLGSDSDTLDFRTLNLLRDNPMLLQADLAEALDVSLPTIKRIMKRLVDRGLLKRVGGKRFGQWVVTEEDWMD